MRSGDDTPSMVRAVEAAAEVADIVVVSVHWGFELDTNPRADDIERAQAMIDAGADIIFGHHQHRLQPLEFIDGKPVFWGMGNFVWPHNSVPSATTAVARVVVNPDGTIEACLIDAFIRTHGRPEITGEAECGPPV
jgi:poly-gamma-glutamate synthesis protein (capsule biosynthesis protein)